MVSKECPITMCYLKHVCCLCLKNSNEMLHYLLTSEDNASYYEKLITSLPQLVFGQSYKDYMLCVECCNNINLVYEFSKRCIKNLSIFLDYEKNCNSDNYEHIIKKGFVEKTGMNITECIEQNKSIKNEFEVKDHKNTTDNEIVHNINNVKPETLDDYADNTQEYIDLKPNNDFHEKIDPALNVETETLTKRCTTTTDKFTQVNIQDKAKFKIEEYANENHLNYEFIACEGTEDFLAVAKDDNSIQNQPEENISCRQTEHENIEIITLIVEKNNTDNEINSEPDHSTTINEESINDSNSLNVSTLLDFCNPDVDKHKKEPQKKTYFCDICQKEFKYPCTLSKHKLIHTGHKPYVCDICGKAFIHSYSLNSHKFVHTGGSVYVCDICKKGFSHSSHLSRHKFIHFNVKPYVCDICDKAFRQLGTLTKHKVTHTGLKPHVCDICNKGFCRLAHLISHKLIHTGQKPYVCDICNKGFNQPSHLASHKLIHTNEKPYVCNVCNKAFRQSGTMVKHKLIHINE